MNISKSLGLLTLSFLLLAGTGNIYANDQGLIARGGGERFHGAEGFHHPEGYGRGPEGYGHGVEGYGHGVENANPAVRGFERGAEEGAAVGGAANAGGGAYVPDYTAPVSPTQPPIIINNTGH